MELVSPLTEQFRFRGRQQVHDLLTAAFTAMDGIQFHTRLRDRATLISSGTVDVLGSGVTRAG